MIPVQLIDLNIQCDVAISYAQASEIGMKMGDVWEVEMDHVDVYKRTLCVKPMRLAERPEGAVDLRA